MRRRGPWPVPGAYDVSRRTLTDSSVTGKGVGVWPAPPTAAYWRICCVYDEDVKGVKVVYLGKKFTRTVALTSS
jgi:hypothetical protein